MAGVDLGLQLMLNHCGLKTSIKLSSLSNYHATPSSIP